MDCKLCVYGICFLRIVWFLPLVLVGLVVFGSRWKRDEVEGVPPDPDVFPRGTTKSAIATMFTSVWGTPCLVLKKIEKGEVHFLALIFPFFDFVHNGRQQCFSVLENC